MKNILVIEDDQSIRDNTHELLELNGYKVQSTKSGHEALNFLKKGSVDVILCDIHMPLMTGYELFERIKGVHTKNHMFFIFMSASVQKKEKAYAMSLGVDGFLDKPFSENMLITTLAEVLNSVNSKKTNNISI